MIYFLIAVACASLFSIMFKLCRLKDVNISQAMLVNYAVGAIFCVCQVAAALKGPADISGFAGSLPFFLAAFLGILYVTGFIVRDYSTQKCGVALTTVSARSALAVPVILSWLFLGDKAPYWLAVIMVLVSLIMIAWPQGGFAADSKTARPLERLTILAELFIIYGICDFSLKFVQHLVSASVPAALVTLVVFVSAFLISLVYCLVKGVFRMHSFSWRELLAGSLIGIANSGCTVMVLRALGQMPATVFYPLYNVSVVLVCTLAGILFFKERPSGLQIAGMVLALAAISLLALK
ncbi:MAG: EamA family transporter [Bacteroidales bacterium]|nr:EamA family transporter [Bacteroidales bacterium]